MPDRADIACRRVRTLHPVWALMQKVGSSSTLHHIIKGLCSLAQIGLATEIRLSGWGAAILRPEDRVNVLLVLVGIKSEGEGIRVDVI